MCVPGRAEIYPIPIIIKARGWNENAQAHENEIHAFVRFFRSGTVSTLPAAVKSLRLLCPIELVDFVDEVLAVFAEFVFAYAADRLKGFQRAGLRVADFA